MLVSEIAPQNVANYCKLDEFVESDINVLLDVSKAFISSYTGLTLIELDEHKEFVSVVYILCQDMHDNRTMYLEKNNLNRVVDTILGMHRTNFLPTPDEVI